MTVAVVSVTYWNGQPLPIGTTPTGAQWAAAFGMSCTNDNGLQRVTYTATANVSGKTATKSLSVLKRFDGAYPEPDPDPTPGGQVCIISASGGVGNVESAYVNELILPWRRDTNYSSSTEMNIYYVAGSRMFSYLRFKIQPGTTCEGGGTLPTGANIVAAEVRLYTVNIGGLPACGWGFCWHVMERVSGSHWNESTLTWNNQPCITSYAVSCQAGGTPSTILFEHGTGNLNWSPRFQVIRSTQLLNDVRDFYTSAPSANNGWVIKEACVMTYGRDCGTITPGFQMRSSRAVNADQRPRLTIWWQ